MGKDHSLLSGVSGFFTERTLEEILRRVCGEEEVEVSSWDFGKASNKGDGYLSVVSKIKVEGKANGLPVEISLVVKSMPENLACRKTFRSTDFFYNEVTWYLEVFPKLEEFLESKGLRDLVVVPRCLAGLTDGENDYLALEDVTALGFRPLARQNPLTLTDCEIILKTLARLHAVSFAYKDQKKEEFQSLAHKLSETFFTPELYDWYKNFQVDIFNVVKDALSREYPGNKAEERIDFWSERKMWDKIVEICSRVDAPTSVIVQGDTWAPNFMLRKSDQDAYPVALTLDFQFARCASPVLDIAFFIYNCTEQSLRKDYYDELLKLYHKELSRCIGLLGSKPEELYPWDLFMTEVQEQSLYGICFALENIPIALLDSSETFDLASIKGDETIDISKIYNLQKIKTKKGRQRLAEAVLHAVEKKYL